MWNHPVMQSVARVASFDKRRREYKRVGWVYATRNPCFADPVFKVGRTKVSPLERVAGLSQSTSVYRPFELVYFVHVSDRDQAEGFAHEALKDARVNPGKEFFEAPLMTIVKALDEAALRWPFQLGRTPRDKAERRAKSVSQSVYHILREYQLGSMYFIGRDVPEDAIACAGGGWPPNGATPVRSSTLIRACNCGRTRQ